MKSLLVLAGLAAFALPATIAGAGGFSHPMFSHGPPPPPSLTAHGGLYASPPAHVGVFKRHEGENRGRGALLAGWPLWWGYDGGTVLYPSGEASSNWEPPAPVMVAPPQPPICPAIWHWNSKLHQGVRQNLC